MTNTLSGQLLVASSLAEDPIVNRSVCLLVHDDSDGAIGVMLNRPMQPSPEQLMALFATDDEKETGSASAPVDTASRLNISESRPESGDTTRLLHFGGPLSGPLVAIHASSEHGEVETGTGIYVAAQKQHLEELVRQQPCPYRLIVGHLGWTAEQLRTEIANGFWHVIPATPGDVFVADGDMWPRLIRRATAASVAAWLGTADVPGSAALN